MDSIFNDFLWFSVSKTMTSHRKVIKKAFFVLWDSHLLMNMILDHVPDAVQMDTRTEDVDAFPSPGVDACEDVDYQR